MKQWIGKLLSVWMVAALCAVLMGPAAGCGKEFGSTLSVAMQGGADTIEKLEKSGGEYDAELYVPLGVEVGVTAFGATVEAPGGYFRARAGRGRGLGERPADAGRTLPAVRPAPPVGDE